VAFEVGEWAWLRLHQRSAVGITDKSAFKLAPRYFGPFQVTERIGAVAYRLLLPAKARIHDVFHVAFLKYIGEPPSSIVPLPVVAHGRAVPTPEKVVRVRPTADSWDLLVQWVGHSAAAAATWERLPVFKEQYPSFKLEDELFCQGGRSVVDTFFRRQFQRKKKAHAPA
jgi:hypothetical protein